ncbi:MAG: glycosyltransferase [Alphaproteobacteria bacterium]|nr:glycosyltransferase [Alphaproteobacteria bacterium]
MTGAPAVSVVMTVYNGGPWLRESLDSVLAQTMTDIELVVVDDASTDGSGDQVAARGDPRIRLLRNDTNLKQTASLNRGLAAARGRYVARMDADDICEPTRLEKQAALMEATPALGIVGSAVRIIDERGSEKQVLSQPCSDAALRFVSMVRNPFHHPTVMIRRDVLLRNGLAYDPRYAFNQDFDLWTRLLPHARAANLAEPLLRYRIHGANMSTTRATEMYEASVAFTARRIRDELPGFQASEAEVRACYASFSGGAPRGLVLDRAQQRAGLRLFARLLDAFAAGRSGDPGLAEARRWAVRLAARALLRSAPSSDSLRLLWRLVGQEPLAPGWLIGDAAALAWSKLRSLPGGAA